MSRQTPTTILTTEQPELTTKAQLRLERDKTYFLDNPNRRLLKRPFVEGEALPYALPPLATVVEVLSSGQRTYIIEDKVYLVIRPAPVKQTEEKRYRGSPILRFFEGRIIGRDIKVRGQVVKREMLVPDLDNPGAKLAVDVPLEEQQ
jgi:hypothetical protein